MLTAKMGKAVVSLFEGVRVEQLIHTRLVQRGEGVEGDPIRIIDQWWDMDGNLVVEVDPCAKEKAERG